MIVVYFVVVVKPIIFEWIPASEFAYIAVIEAAFVLYPFSASTSQFAPFHLALSHSKIISERTGGKCKDRPCNFESKTSFNQPQVKRDLVKLGLLTVVCGLKLVEIVEENRTDVAQISPRNVEIALFLGKDQMVRKGLNEPQWSVFDGLGAQHNIFEYAPSI